MATFAGSHTNNTVGASSAAAASQPHVAGSGPSAAVQQGVASTSGNVGSPPGLPTVAAQTLAPPGLPIVSGSPSGDQKLPPEVLAALKKAASKHERTLGRYAATIRRWLKAKSDVATLSLDDVEKYPAGVKRFSSVESQHELDIPWSQSSTGAKSLTVVIPQAATRRQAMALIYRSYLRTTREIDLEALQESKESLKDLSSRASFLKLCQETVTSSDADVADFEQQWDLES